MADWIDPANVGAALAQLERWPQARPMVIARFLSTRTRRLLSERGASWADATGNLRVALAHPPVFVELAGAITNPFGRRDLPLRSLKGTGSAAVVRALCDYRPPFTVSQLARDVGLPVASVLRVVDLLLREALLEKASKRGAIVSVDWPGLLSLTPLKPSSTTIKRWWSSARRRYACMLQTMTSPWPPRQPMPTSGLILTYWVTRPCSRTCCQPPASC